MKKRALNKNRIFTVLEILFTLLNLGTAMAITDATINEAAEAQAAYSHLFEVFLFLGLARLFRAINKRKISKLLFSYLMMCAVVYLGCSAALLFVEYSANVNTALSTICWGMMLLGRVQSIIRKHKWRNVLLNVLLILLVLLYGTLAALGHMPLELTLFIVSLQAICFIMEVVFSGFQIDILAKIIRKTYAAEILFGLLVLIVATSYMLIHTEEAIADFEDALWYCFAIVTTIGFGDFTATSRIGRVLSVILGMYGIVVVALITSVIVNFYGEMKRTDNEAEKEEKQAEEGKDEPPKLEQAEQRTS